MHAHIVLAHPEPRSFNGHLAGLARRSLEGRGWSTSLSDLYALHPAQAASRPHVRAIAEARRRSYL
jgi:NAD(P)H dehydrogenase (quinone)